MNKWLKISSSIAFFGIIAACLGYKFVYNKLHKDYEEAEAYFSLTSQELYSDYQINRQVAEQKFNGKVVEISGFLDKVETPESMTIAVFVLSDGIFGDEGIRCTMLLNHSENIMSNAGQKVKLKGYCTGYNDTDVILEKCSIVEL